MNYIEILNEYYSGFIDDDDDLGNQFYLED